jgi:drug/metabolite transporter (DMT)-like permease
MVMIAEGRRRKQHAITHWVRQGQQGGRAPGDRMQNEGDSAFEECPDAGGTPEAARGSSDVRAYVYLALMVALGSTTAAAAKVAVKDLPIALLPVVRFGVAGLCVLPVIWGRRGLWRLIREDGVTLILAAAMCVPVNQGFFLSATRLGPTTHVGIFYATAPLVVLLGAWAMRLERPDLGRLWGVLASVAGIAVIGVGNLWEDRAALSGDVRAVALCDVLLVGAVLSWGAYVILSKPLIVRHGALTVLAATFLAGSALMLPAALWTVPGWRAAGAVSPAAWLALAYLAFVVTPLGQACQNLALHRLDASHVATFSNASPLLTVVWGIVLFDEILSPALLLGGGLTLGGIFWTTRLRHPQRAPAASATSAQRAPARVSSMAAAPTPR